MQHSVYAFHYFYFFIDRFLYISTIFKENVSFVFYICVLDNYNFKVNQHSQCVWTKDLPLPCTQGVSQDKTKEWGLLSRLHAAVSDTLLFPRPRVGAAPVFWGFFRLWLRLLWELGVWQIALMFHDNAASVVWVSPPPPPCRSVCGHRLLLLRPREEKRLGAEGVELRSSDFRFWTSILQFGGETNS